MLIVFVDSFVVYRYFNIVSILLCIPVDLPMLSWRSFTSTPHDIFSKLLAAFPQSKQRTAVREEWLPLQWLINPRKEYWQNQGSNQWPPAFEPSTSLNEKHGLSLACTLLISIDLCKGGFNHLWKVSTCIDSIKFWPMSACANCQNFLLSLDFLYVKVPIYLMCHSFAWEMEFWFKMRLRLACRHGSLRCIEPHLPDPHQASDVFAFLQLSSEPVKKDAHHFEHSLKGEHQIDKRDMPTVVTGTDSSPVRR